MVNVLFLCLGNICRSPMAEAVFKRMVDDSGLTNEIEVDSAGLGGWHAGERPHQGTLDMLVKKQIPHDWIRSRQIQKADLKTFDYIVAMDAENMDGLRRLGANPGERVFRLLELVEDRPDKNVPDPYYTGNFDEVYEMVEAGCERLLQKIKQEHHL